MPQEVQVNEPVKPPNPIWGTVLRVGFYVVVAFVSLQLASFLLYNVLGPVIAATIGVFTAAFTANLLTIRIFDRRPIADIGLETTPGAGRNFGLGVAIGAGAAAVMLALPLLGASGHLVWNKNNVPFAWSRLLFYFGTLLFGAAGEEILFRGYAFQLLIQKMGPFATVLPVGVLFGLAHAGNSSSTILSILNTSLWGIILGIAFWRSRDLWLPIGLHFGWNAVLPVFGVNLSGLTIDLTRYVYQWDLSPLWSGGAYGPEGGLLTTIFGALVLYVVLRAPVAKQTARIARVLNEPD
jgi:membrane protease YdiL (CAAX protease family)